MKEPIKFEWKGNHHLYYGIFLVVFGLFNVYMGTDNGNLSELSNLWWTIIGIGGFCVVDDIIEHTVTSETPLRKLYLLLFKLKE
jgi:uncharacterized membrane protein